MSRLLYKSFTGLIVFLLCFMNLFGMLFSDSQGLSRSDIYQPDNSFQKYLWGGICDQKNAGYGWNISYIKNFNGDSYPDLVIGAPEFDYDPLTNCGGVFIFFGSANFGFNNINHSNADITIYGDSSGNNFGWDLADAGDQNNDGFNDLIVGSPGALNNLGRAYIFYGGNLPSGSYSASAIADRILTGHTPDGLYGSAVSGIGDIDNDGFEDVIVGAPAADEAIISFGFDKLITIYPNIWDDDPSTPGIVDFSKGANNTLNDNNTWGRLAGDDGWDWTDAIADTQDRVYGHHVTTPAHGTTIDIADCYGPWEPGGPDGDNLTRGNRSALQVIAGRTRETSNPYGPSGSDDPMTSAAWGIEFNITTEMMNYISSNSTIIISFNYESWDNEKVFNTNPSAGTEELCTVRSRLWNSSGKYYLGDIIKNNERYIFYHYQEYGTPEWDTVIDSFKYDISEFIDLTGTYYWDFGCSFGSSDINQNNNDPDEGILTYFDDVSMLITNEREVVIEGARLSGFGTSITSVGDINSDGYPDILIGAPRLDAGYALLFHGKKHFKPVESMNQATMILSGKEDGDLFGYSVSSAGDVDNDDVQDIIIGAPGGCYANLYFGSTLNLPPLLPDLWENDIEKDTPQIEFDSGLKTTGNSPGLDGDDDGWDIWNGVYGYSGGNAGSSVKYNGADSPNPTQIAIDDKLLIGIGAHFGNDAEPDSGAYGVEFSVNQDMITNIQAGGEVVISYDWNFENLELENDETLWMKTYLRNPTTNFDLGWDLDSQATTNNKDQSKEIYWTDTPGDMHDVFIQKCSECFVNSGSYYLDFGGKIRSWTSTPTNIEDGIFHFDNIHLQITPPPNIKFIGPPNSGFGFSLGHPDKLNFDSFGDIIIGAPYYDSPNGLNSGAIFGFYSILETNKQILVKNADFVLYGENANDKFGWVLMGEHSLDSDEFTEFFTSAVGYDSSTATTNVGKVYLLSITKKPRIRLIHPLDDEFLIGNVTVNATVTDPDNNLDIDYGVRFYYSTDLVNWQQIGIDRNQNPPNNIYEHYWDTTIVADNSNYYVKSWVRDLDLNVGENISSAITIDNPHPPNLKITSPLLAETIAGLIDIKVKVKDSDLDLIRGGINNTRGVNFYISTDKIAWKLLASVKNGVQAEYIATFDTEKYIDGNYWLKVNASDWDGFEVEELINVTIDNPSRPPNVFLLSPSENDELSGSVMVQATAFDFDDDINNSGVTFYISPATALKDWRSIGNSPIPEKNSSGANIYSIVWDTTTVDDYWYQIKAFVMDNESLTNESVTSEFKVHNNVRNPPSIELTLPKCGDILKETQMISARVRDLEDNIDSHGVDYYYSEDKVQWRYIGTAANPRSTDTEYYDFLWQTNTIPDGEYWLNVSVSDDTQLKSWDVSDCTVFIHNSNLNAPFVKILTPKRGQHINGTFTVQALAFDLENNINTNGVLFLYSTDKTDWTVISNVPSPTGSQDTTYELFWDTKMLPDGKYWLRAEATDFDGLSGIGTSEYFFIHNSLENPPIVTLLAPNSGEISGVVKVNASVFDLENNINENGIDFYYSNDNETWQRIANDPSGIIIDDQEQYFEISWDTSLVHDDFYWLRAQAQDLTQLTGQDISDDYIIVHNKLNNPPRIIFKQPQKGIPLDPIQSIIVEVIDFDKDVDTVSFLYSANNETWVLIDSRLKPEKDNIYKTMWVTEKINNGNYYIKVVAKDKMGNQEQIIEGPFEVVMGKKEGGAAEEGFLASNLVWIIIVIIVIIIMTLLIISLLRRSKRREKELIEEVSAELRGTKTPKSEKETVPSRPPEVGVDMGAEADELESIQTIVPVSQAPALEEQEYEPDVDTIEAYRNQMDAWKSEGYDISRLEQYSKSDDTMFSRTFPIFASNISKLKNISRQLDTMNTDGYESQADPIRAKLFNPDQALVAEREFKDLEQKLGLTTSRAPALGTTPTEEGAIPELPEIDEMLPQLLPAETGTTLPQIQSPGGTQQGEDKKSEDKE